MINKNYLKEINNYAVLTVTQEKELAIRMVNGDQEAREEFINGNLRLVISNACQVYNILGDYITSNLTVDDLIQYGNIGLIKAVDKFDYKTGHKFSTYATWWIKKEISDGINILNNTITLPKHIIDSIAKVKNAQKALNIKFDAEPTPAQIAEYLGKGYTEEKIERLFTIMDVSHPTSLDNPTDADKDPGDQVTYADITSDNDESVAESTNKEHTHQILMKAMKENLTEREALVIRCLLGYETGSEMTLDQTATYIGNKGFFNKDGEVVTKQAIALIYKKDIKVLQRALKTAGLN